MTTALIMGLCALGCLAVVAAPLPSSEMIDPDSSRAAFTRRSEARSAATIFAVALLGFGAFAALARGTTWPIAPLALVTMVGLMALHPWLAVRWICIPLGLPRLAIGLGNLGGHPWVRDPEGGAVLAGVLAQLRRPIDPAMHAWLRGRLRRGPLRGAGLIAAGLLAADEGDRDTARTLLGSLDDLDPDLCPPLARRIALDWLVADAVRDGDWDRVLTLANDYPAPSRTVRLMVVLAGIHRAESTRSPWWPWLCSPRRRHTLALVRGALTGSSQGTTFDLQPLDLADASLLAANDGGPCPTEALSLHVEATLSGMDPDAAGSSARMTRLGAAWDRSMNDFGFRGQIRRRAESLRCTIHGEKVMARLHREVCEDMARMLVRGAAPTEASGGGLTLRRSVAQMHSMALEELEAYAALVSGPRPEFVSVDHVVSQWLTWLQVRRRYQALARVAAPELRANAYTVIELHLRQLMAWLWNDVGERGLANAISTWLLLEAERVHDEESAAYHRHNVALVI